MRKYMLLFFVNQCVTILLLPVKIKFITKNKNDFHYSRVKT